MTSYKTVLEKWLASESIAGFESNEDTETLNTDKTVKENLLHSAR